MSPGMSRAIQGGRQTRIIIAVAQPRRRRARGGPGAARRRTPAALWAAPWFSPLIPLPQCEEVSRGGLPGCRLPCGLLGSWVGDVDGHDDYL